MTVVLLYGGRSTEHEVSLVSAAGVLLELNRVPDLDTHLVGITREGRWFLQDGETQRAAAVDTGSLTLDSSTDRAVAVVPGQGFVLLRTGEEVPADCVFPVLHGTFGEDGTIQGLLETAGLPYVGSGVTGSAVGMDKLRTKQLWERRGLPVVPYFAMRQADHSETDRLIREAFGYPVFLKPNAAGSSIGISRVTGKEELPAALARAFTVDSTVLVEQAFPVREIETSVLGNGSPRTFPPGEVVPSHEFYDYDAKYTDPHGADLVIPAELPSETAERIRTICAEAFQAIDGAGLARVDCFLHTETGEIYLNEINTIPGFTPISMYPKMVEHGGVSYGTLLQELLRLAIERAGEQRARDYRAR